jgi:hypothetical protein
MRRDGAKSGSDQGGEEKREEEEGWDEFSLSLKKRVSHLIE